MNGPSKDGGSAPISRLRRVSHQLVTFHEIFRLKHMRGEERLRMRSLGGAAARSILADAHLMVDRYGGPN
jgi:hypothetical protein